MKKNLYYRNIYGYYNGIINSDGISNFITLLNQKLWHGIYLKYIEIPITTFCSLNCKECSNLIQYYQHPYHVDKEILLNSVAKLVNSINGIFMLRILGGEPLVSDNLLPILTLLNGKKNVKQIQIVTNGTSKFTDDQIAQIKLDKRITVDISNYGDRSWKANELKEQLKKNNIVYYTQDERIFWTQQANVSNRQRTVDELKNVYKLCTIDCISMLNGCIHVCPRSSHGMDLGIFECKKQDYVDVLNEKNIRKKLYELLNTEYVDACNYCDNYRWETLPEVKAAEQISKKDAYIALEGMKNEKSDK